MSENVPVVQIDEAGTPVVRTDAEALIAKAIEKDVPVETMEKLLAMRKELKAEAAKESFFRDLSRFQSGCPEISKGKSVNVETKSGGHYSYNYAPLDVIVAQVKEPLRSNGFSYTIRTKQDKEAVTAICDAHHRDGHTESTEFMVPIDLAAKMNPAQQTASALTYAKRYAFCNMFGIMTADQDDDGHSSGASGNGKQWGMRKCPVCGEETVIKGKKEYGGGYVCWKAKGGCGATFADESLTPDSPKDVTDLMGSPEQRKVAIDECQSYYKQLDSTTDEMDAFIANLEVTELPTIQKGVARLKELYRDQEVKKGADLHND